MNLKKLTVCAFVLLWLLILALPAAAADHPKKGKDQEGAKDDPWAGRFGLSISGGGVSSSAGLGFEGRLGLAYYINRYFHVELQPGFGTYPINYSAPDGNQETAYLKYIPVDLSLIVTPVKFERYTPYFGPGVGLTYYWWTEKTEDPDDPTQTVETDFDETLYSVFVTAGVSISMGGPFAVSAGVTYTIPDVSNFSTEDGIFSFGFSGGVVF